MFSFLANYLVWYPKSRKGPYIKGVCDQVGESGKSNNNQQHRINIIYRNSEYYRNTEKESRVGREGLFMWLELVLKERKNLKIQKRNWGNILVKNKVSMKAKEKNFNTNSSSKLLQWI